MPQEVVEPVGFEGAVFHPPTMKRRVKGTVVEVHGCHDILVGIPLNLVKVWYAIDYSGAVWPIIARDRVGELTIHDHLYYSARKKLNQFEVVKSGTINENRSFTIEWDVPKLHPNAGVPWLEAYLANEGYDASQNVPPLTDYTKVTAIEALTIEPAAQFYSIVHPLPIITFFDGEEEKDVGQLKLIYAVLG